MCNVLFGDRGDEKMSLPKVNTEYENLIYYLWKKNFRPYIEIESHFVDDIQSELRTIALEIDAMNDFGDNTVYQVIQAKIYRFIRNYGFRRPKGHSRYVSSTKSLQRYADIILN